jgi:inner membrane protein
MAGVGHIAVGMAAARWASQPPPASRNGALAARMIGWSLLSMLPDADVVGFSLGVAYGSPWGHRGATHSLVFAVIVGVVVALLARVCGRPAMRVGVLATVVVASHGLLDTLTDGGRGCALLWPFVATRYFAPVNPIPVSPIGIGVLSPRGLYVAAFELLLFAPFLAYAWWPRRRGRFVASGVS